MVTLNASARAACSLNKKFEKLRMMEVMLLMMMDDENDETYETA